MKTQSSVKIRKFVSLGIFCPRICRGDMIEDVRLKFLYNKLISLGFRETKWQFIYDGQIAGLVFPYNDGLNEIHIRFYKDRIFSEFEVGRSSIAHFFGPFFNANEFVLNLIKNEIDEDIFSLAKSLTSRNKLRKQELELDIWNENREKRGGKDINFSFKKDKKFQYFIATIIQRYFGWNNVNNSMFVAFSLTLALNESLIFTPILLVVWRIMSKLAPQSGNP